MHNLLISLNSSKDQNVEKFKKNARSFHANWVASLGRYKTMTATIHLILAHGHLYIEYAQNELNCPNGWLSESSIEGANKLNRFLRFFRSRKNSLRNERIDMMVRHLWMSDPHIIACYDMAVVAKGRIRKSKKQKR
jgi:hypothetical protein